MVSPSESWEEVENGYRKGETGIFVEQTFVQGGEVLRKSECQNSNSSTVSIRRKMETAYHTWNTLVSFSEARTAWEYANLVTHYIEETSGSPRQAEAELMGESGYEQETWTPPPIVEEMSALEVMRKMTSWEHEEKINAIVSRLSD